MENKRKNSSKLLYWFILALILIVIYKVGESFAPIKEVISKFLAILKPFFMGLLISYLLYIPCRNIEKIYRKSKSKFVKKRVRGLSVLTVYILAILLILIIVNFILPIIVESGTDFVNNIDGYYNIAVSKIRTVKVEGTLVNEILNNLNSEIQGIDLKQYVSVSKISQYARNLIDFAHGIFNLFITIIVSVYILLGRSKIVSFFSRLAKAMFKPKMYKSVKRYFYKSNEIFFKYISSQLIAVSIVGLLATIIMLILDVKYGVLLGILIGLFNLIPYFGALFAVGFAVIITLITGGLTKTVWMAILLIIVQQIDANITTPKIVGESLKISPLVVIFSVTIGGAYFGILGMFLAVPISAVIKLIIEEYIEYKETEEQIKN